LLGLRLEHCIFKTAIFMKVHPRRKLP
jgi:hypothetical protein